MNCGTEIKGYESNPVIAIKEFINHGLGGIFGLPKRLAVVSSITSGGIKISIISRRGTSHRFRGINDQHQINGCRFSNGMDC